METPERKPEETPKPETQVEEEEGPKYDGGEIPRVEPPSEK